MSLPTATTTISILRPPDTVSPEDASYDLTSIAPATVATGIAAVIGISPSGRSELNAGSQEVLNFRLSADPCDLRHTDIVLDESTGEKFQVMWVKARTGLGLDHVAAGLRSVIGASLS